MVVHLNKPKSDPTFNAWRCCNNMVVSWLVHSVSLFIRQSILWMDQADEIWKDLKSRYAQGDHLCISDLQYEASSMKQGDLSVTDFFTKLCIIWDEIENFRADPVCLCNVKCSCVASSIIAQQKLEDRAVQFLRGLNDSYSNIRSHVLLMDPLPPISKIFSYVAQQERQLLNPSPLMTVNSNSKDIMLNVATSTNTCTYCGRKGHTASSDRSRNFKYKNSKSNKICTHCGRSGHTIEVCYRKHGFPPGHPHSSIKSAHINSSVTVDPSAATGDQQPAKNSDVCFTPQQYQALLALIQQPEQGTSTSHVN
uniref:Retrotransposon gag domain-containing protein n=1 Tax=Cajanus cajan TaxID=3821 RepID=A0A151RV31_CAJCA|nr:hypothetical protein KK1_031983 [Cajanus cajan]